MNDYEFLNWLADRLVYVYGESPNVSYVHRLREISERLKENEKEVDSPQPIIFNNVWFWNNEEENA